MTIFCVFDTETNGLPVDGIMPDIVQIAAITFDSNTSKFDKINHVVKLLPESEFNQDACDNCHGITIDNINKNGINLIDALYDFILCANQSDIVIAHNIHYDKCVVKRALINLSNCARTRSDHKKCTFMYELFTSNITKKMYCTMKTTVNSCQLLPRGYSCSKSEYKYPKLSELYHYLFPNKPHQLILHDALNDVIICAICYFKHKHDINICDICHDMKQLIEKNTQQSQLLPLI